VNHRGDDGCELGLDGRRARLDVARRISRVLSLIDSTLSRAENVRFQCRVIQ